MPLREICGIALGISAPFPPIRVQGCPRGNSGGTCPGAKFIEGTHCYEMQIVLASFH